MIYPKPLRHGDRVALLAPSGPIDKSLLKPSVQSLEKLSLRVQVMDSCRQFPQAELKQVYLSGPDSLRADDINQAFADPDIRGVIALRGGYGAQRLLPYLDYEMISHHPKVFAGYSDITALHMALNQFCGFVTFHAPMPASELCKNNVDAFTLDAFRHALMKDIFFTAIGGRQRTDHSRSKGFTLRNPAGHPLETIVPGRAEGRLVGGNLSLLASSVGTPYEVDTASAILFLEEVNEEPYRVDRLLLQLKLAGKFRDCAGILLGYFTGCENPPAVAELLIPEQKPTLAGLCCGHALPTLTIPLGATAQIDTFRKKITLHSPSDTL